MLRVFANILIGVIALWALAAALAAMLDITVYFPWPILEFYISLAGAFSSTPSIF